MDLYETKIINIIIIFRHVLKRSKSMEMRLIDDNEGRDNNKEAIQEADHILDIYENAPSGITENDEVCTDATPHTSKKQGTKRPKVPPPPNILH